MRIKANYGYVGTKDKNADVIADSKNVPTPKGLIAGLGLIATGLVLTVINAFTYGATAYAKGEDDALVQIGCLGDNKDIEYGPEKVTIRPF